MAQHLEALERANFVRLARVDLKRAIKAGEVKVSEILMGEIPDWLERMELWELCQAIPRYQWRFHQRLMQDTNTSLNPTLGVLTDRKCSLIAEGLAEWEEGADARRRARSRRHRVRTDTARRRAA